MTTQRAFIVSVAFASLASVAFAAIAVFAHGGGLDANGGHNDRKSGGYHFHRAQASPIQSYSPPPDVYEPEEPQFARGESKRQPRTRIRTAARTSARSTARERDAREAEALAFKPLPESPYAGMSEAEKREKLAAARLKIAQQWYEQGDLPLAIKWLKRCVADYPETASGKKAAVALAKIERAEK